MTMDKRLVLILYIGILAWAVSRAVMDPDFPKGHESGAAFAVLFVSAFFGCLFGWFLLLGTGKRGRS
jgi:hypothetical protein